MKKYEPYEWEMSTGFYHYEPWISPYWRGYLEEFKGYGNKYKMPHNFLKAMDTLIFYISEFDGNGFLTDDEWDEYNNALEDFMRLFLATYGKARSAEVRNDMCFFKDDVLFHFSHFMGGDLSNVV